MNKAFKIFQILVLITIGFTQSAKSQFRVKSNSILKINITECSTKQDSAQYAQIVFKVECMGTNSRGELQQEFMYTRVGIPIRTNIEFTTLKVNVTVVDSDIKPQSFTFSNPKGIETINMEYNSLGL